MWPAAGGVVGVPIESNCGWRPIKHMLINFGPLRLPIGFLGGEVMLVMTMMMVLVIITDSFTSIGDRGGYQRYSTTIATIRNSGAIEI